GVAQHFGLPGWDLVDGEPEGAWYRPNPEPPAPRKILFVHNHVMGSHEIFARMAVEQFLGANEVTVVPSLAVAHRALEAQGFEALLVDYDLADAKGDALIRALRVGGSRVAIVGVSSKDEENQALLEAGADATCERLEFHNLPALLDALALAG